MGNVFIVGCGYVGEKIAERYVGMGSLVVGLSRSPWYSEKYRTMEFDLDDEVLPEEIDWEEAEVFYLAPPKEGGIEEERVAGFVKGIEGKGVKRVVYFSTTGVYGDYEGEWVNEQSECKTEQARSLRRLAGEKLFLESSIDAVILRVSGIYGPGRLPVEKVRAGEAIVRLEESPWSNRIHVEDLVEVSIKAMERGSGIYNVSDGTPEKMSMLYVHLADLMGLPRPREVEKEEFMKTASPMMREFLSSSTKVDSRRMVEELVVELKYGEWLEGLRASL